MITFAFSGYSKSVKARNCRSDRRETGTQIGQIGKKKKREFVFIKTVLIFQIKKDQIKRYVISDF